MINFLFLGATELIILVALVLLLFGGKKIPGLLKGIGSGIRGFKQEIKEDDKKKPADKEKSDNSNSSQNQLEQ